MDNVEFTKNELIIWYNNKLINPRTNRKIKENRPVYQKLEKEYNIMLKNKDVVNIIDIEKLNINEKDKSKNKNNIEYKINKFLEEQIYLRYTQKPKVYDYQNNIMKLMIILFYICIKNVIQSYLIKRYYLII